MIKHKTREELIELVYKLESNNQDLKECTKLQHKILTDISEVYHKEHKGFFNKLIWYIKRPFEIITQINNYKEYFYTHKINKFNIMNQEQLIQALNYINDYENKKASPVLYMQYIENITGVKVCKSCGNANARLHNDFQRRILNIMRNEYPYLAQPIKLISGKYGQSHFMDNIPFYTFNHLEKLVKRMKSDLVLFKKRGLDEAVILGNDIDTLENYIKLRKQGTVQKTSKEDDTDAIIDSKEDTPVVQNKPSETLKSVESIESMDKSLDTLKTTIESVEKVVTEDKESNVELTMDEKLQKGLELKKEGTHLKTISKAIDLPYKGLSAALKEYENRIK